MTGAAAPRRPVDMRAAVRALVGWSPSPAAPAVRIVDTREEPFGRVEECVLAGTLPATLVRPARRGPLPAVLYCHAHGFQYARGRSELLAGAKSLTAPWGPELAERGFLALAIDLAGFGARQGEGSESALSKAHHWRGTTLFGAMLADLGTALAALRADGDVDAERVFAAGLSMGAMHAMWLGALDEALAGVVQMCVLSDLAPLMAHGAHDLHAPYLTVPGLLNVAEMGDLAGLVAPRPQFIGLGARDPLTPAPAREAALARVREAYRAMPEQLAIHLEPDSGHAETPAMRAAAFGLLTRWAGQPR